MHKPILLVDDSPFDSEFVLRALRTCKLSNRVLLAYDGEEALATLDAKSMRTVEEHVGLILLDVKLPKMDGFEVFKLIRSRPSLRAIPVIFVSGSMLQDDRSRAQILGADGFVTKMADSEEFAELLCAAITPFKHALTS